MFKQQLIGTINLSVPVIVLYFVYPSLFAHTTGIIACSLMVGLYIWYLNWRQAKALESSLKFVPTAEYQAKFNTLMRECEVNPDDINVRYAYTNEQIAMMVNNMVIVDPVLWDIQDSEALKVKQIFDLHIKPAISKTQELRLSGIKEALNPAAERFIFKHELGHIVNNFSQKKLFGSFIIGSLAAFCGIYAAMMVVHINGLLAIAAGVIVGGFYDLVYTYTMNAAWKFREEKAADRFAAQYSSPDDIIAAAKFFAKHQEIINSHKEPGNWLAVLPSEITTGHQNGYKRSVFLRALATSRSQPLSQ